MLTMIVKATAEPQIEASAAAEVRNYSVRFHKILVRFAKSYKFNVFF